MSGETIYRDPTDNDFPNDYDLGKVDSRIKLRTNAIRTKMYGKDVRGAVAEAAELSGVVSKEAKDASELAEKASNEATTAADNISQRFDNQIAGSTNDSEVIDYRHSNMLSKSFETARQRGDFVDEDLQLRGINVRWFGAKGDGTTDDTDAFLTAISVADANGYDVYVPLGKYLITKTLSVSGMSFKGAHLADTYIFPQGVTTLLQLGDDAHVSDFCIADRLNGTDITNIALGGTGLDSGGNVIERLSIKGDNGTYQSTGIKAAPTGTADDNHHVFPNTIKDITIFDISDGIVLDSANYGWVNGNLIENITVQGFTHSAVWLNASAAKGTGVSHNTFRNIQAEYLASAPTTARAFRINYGVNNKFEMIHTWQDQGTTIQIPSMLLKPASSVKNTDIKNNVFDGIFESEIEFDEDSFGFNDLSKVALSYWMKPHFNNQIASLNGSQDTPTENLLPINLISDFVSGIPSPLMLEGSAKLTKRGVDANGPFVQFEALSDDQTSGTFEFALNRIQSAVKDLSKMTVGVEFDLADGDDAEVSMSPSIYTINGGTKTALPRVLTQVSKNALGVYRMTACVDNSNPPDGSYCISAFWGQTKIMRIRRFFLVGGWVGPNVKLSSSVVTHPWVYATNSKLTLASASNDLIKQLGIISAGSGAQNFWLGISDVTEIQRSDTTYEYRTPFYC